MKKTIAFLLPLAFLLCISACSDSTKDALPTSAEVKNTVTVVNWGPQFTKAGASFAVQANGNSALWFEQRGIHSAESVQVWFDNTQLKGMAITPNVGGSAEVPPALISKPGKYPVYLILKPQNQRVDLGTFEVLP
jgi:hypothetical protein